MTAVGFIVVCFALSAISFVSYLDWLEDRKKEKEKEVLQNEKK